jgi:hypothetical protein
MSAKNMATGILCQLHECGEIQWELAACFSSARNGSFLLLVESDALRDGISMNAQGVRGFGKVGLIPNERLLNVHLFKLVKCFSQQYVAVKHFIN